MRLDGTRASVAGSFRFRWREGGGWVPGAVAFSMSDLIINVSFGLAAPARRDPAGNRKHRNFVRRRRLERKRALGQKQRPAAPQPGGGLPRKRGCRARGKRRPEAGGGEREEHEENDPPGSSGGTKPSARSTTQETGTKGSQRAKKATKALVRAPGLPPAPSKFVAIDCEMVGTGPGGRNSDLARCSIVDYEGDVLYDRYVRPAEPIVDYRTRWSGIRKQHMANAVPFCKAQREVWCWGWCGHGAGKEDHAPDPEDPIWEGGDWPRHTQ
ncbi:interferon-stimulated 20 kDa exonuclease-like 2 isoform X2 [Numida meleagris]|uniref:interferon-stimulated 20 kDa exonuclease-like 2 isoform X2 n=1 Tax=Numida meleagris TaxID=8996 RepID=UPI000B3E20B3|nr:interferon-stimulated 20 kDa exonuclease-like 2 isoform X2 [Numida meleagris]